MISTFKYWYQIKPSRPVSQHTMIPMVWVWPVSHVMLVTKTRVRLARWSQEKSGPLLWAMRWRRQSGQTRQPASRDIRLCHDPVPPLQSVTVGAEDQLLAAIILFRAVCMGEYSSECQRVGMMSFFWRNSSQNKHFMGAKTLPFSMYLEKINLKKPLSLIFWKNIHPCCLLSLLSPPVLQLGWMFCLSLHNTHECGPTSEWERERVHWCQALAGTGRTEAMGHSRHCPPWLSQCVVRVQRHQGL